MPTRYPEIFAELCRPRPEFVRVRKHDGMKYITARVVQNILDTVLGPENWWPKYEVWSEDAVMCHLTIVLPDGTQLTKSDVGSYTRNAESNSKVDPGDDDKAGVSDSLKRAAVHYGIGRWLYDDGIPSYDPSEVPNDPAMLPQATPVAAPATHAPSQPQRGGWAGAGTDAREPRRQPSANGQGGGQRNYDGPPRSGKALFAWTKDQEQKYEVGLLKYLNNWAKLQEFPSRMVDWDGDQVALAHAEAVRKLKSEGHIRSEDSEDVVPDAAPQYQPVDDDTPF